MSLDKQLLQHFEAGLESQRLGTSTVPGRIIGYGEISAIFQILGDNDNVYKRLPVFDNRSSAQRYASMHTEYCDLLERAGLKLPAWATQIVRIPGRPVVLYIAQQRFANACMCHRRIHALDDNGCLSLIEKVAVEIAKVWAFNRKTRPEMELAIDGQLSNWVSGASEGRRPQLLYIDTSTPLMRKNGVEQINPERLLQSAPRFLRWIIRGLFLKDVTSRCYAPRLVYTDLAANLFKEQRPELVPETVAIANRLLSATDKPLTVRSVKRYYAEDKLIWTVFLAFRRIDRWLKIRLMRRRYEFILPSAIHL